MTGFSPAIPLLCCGWKNDRFGTGTREEWRGKLQKLQFIVPNPMTAEEGARKTDGKLSPRTLENTGPRRFLVIEFDDKLGEDSQAARLWHPQHVQPSGACGSQRWEVPAWVVLRSRRPGIGLAEIHAVCS